jgi:hypothetical protein
MEDARLGERPLEGYYRGSEGGVEYAQVSGR